MNGRGPIVLLRPRSEAPSLNIPLASRSILWLLPRDAGLSGPMQTLVNSASLMCVLASTSTLLAELLFRVSAVECTVHCYRHTSVVCRLAIAARPQSGSTRWPAKPWPATEEGPWRSQSSSLMVPTNTIGWSMHARILWCANHALRWSVACTGPLRASWPGRTGRISGTGARVRARTWRRWC